MGKKKNRGRPAKHGPREPNGRHQRETREERKASEKLRRLAEQNSVLAQPHRRDSHYPRHEWHGSAVGRFLLPHAGKAPEAMAAYYDAADSYRSMYRRWQRARGVQNPIREEAPGGVVERSPKEQAAYDDRIRDLGERIGEINLVIAELTHVGFVAMRDAIVYEMDIPPLLEDEAMLAFGRLAVENAATGRGARSRAAS